MKNLYLPHRPNEYVEFVHFSLRPSFGSYSRNKYMLLEHIMEFLGAETPKKRNKKKDCLLNFSLVLICTQCSHKPALVPMMESSLWEIAQHCHDKDFWTEDRFDYKFLSVCQLLIIHRVGGFRRWSSKNETEKWKISFKYVNKKNLNTLTATTNIFESGFHSMKQFMPYFEIDSGVRFVITIGTQGYVK